MINEILGRLRHAVLFKICGRRACDELGNRKLARHEVRAQLGGDADGEVEAFFDQIYQVIAYRYFHAHIRILAGVLEQHRAQMIHAEIGRDAHT